MSLSCLLFSFQPRSFLSSPEMGNCSLGSSTMEQELIFVFHFQELGDLQCGPVCLGDKNATWTGHLLCPELSTSEQSWLGTEANPANACRMALGEEGQGLASSLCVAAGLEHSFAGLVERGCVLVA